jgi:hypothetical protein
MKKRTACVAYFLIFLAVAAAQAQTTAFTYQGSLQNGGTPANGSYDFEFALFSAVSGGGQLGTTQTLSAVAVANGIFTVTLNFGEQFPGANRFLEVRVRTAGGGAFTPLTPRQQINSGPYAVRSLSALNAANAFTLEGLGMESFIQNSSAQQPGGFNVSGTGSAGVLDAATQFNIAGQRVISLAGTSNTFVGLSTGNAITTGSQNSFFGQGAGQDNTSGSFNSFFGLAAGRANTTGSENSFFGRGSGFGNISGSRNAFFGRSAGLSNQVGSENSFFGYEAGHQSNTSNNSFFGFKAGRETTGINNSFFGWSSGLNTTTGTNNSFFGVQSGLNNQTGIRNVFIGRDAGRENVAGNENVFVGFNAGLNSNGSNNTAIGSGTSVGTNLTFATAIGAGVTVSESNTVRIGRSTDDVFVGTLRPGTIYLGDTNAELGITGTDHDGYIVEMYNFGAGYRSQADVLKLTVQIDSSLGGNPGPLQTNNFIAFKVIRDPFGNVLDAGAIQGNNNGGVELLTSGSDYAEYMPRLDKTEKFQSGDIVGVQNGYLTKKTGSLYRSMVISTGPAVLGNYPGEKELDKHEKVAFIGQAPVRVKGAVNAGDFIIPSGQNDGTGIAVSPEAISPEQFDVVVGQAWESSKETEVKLIRTAVGLVHRDPTVGRLIATNHQQAKRLAVLEAKLNAIEARLTRQNPSSQTLASRVYRSRKSQDSKTRRP